MALHLKYAAAAIGLLRKLFFFYVCFLLFLYLLAVTLDFFVILPLEN